MGRTWRLGARNKIPLQRRDRLKRKAARRFISRINLSFRCVESNANLVSEVLPLILKYYQSSVRVDDFKPLLSLIFIQCKYKL